MFKAIIIDDEFRARRVLKNLIESYTPTVNIIAEAEDVANAVKVITKHQPDLVFLDIEMPAYNGFQLLDFFEEVNFEIIFVTSYSEYALQAFNVQAIDYILKPIQIETLKRAIEKATKYITAKHQPTNTLQNDTDELKKIQLSLINEKIFVNINDIIFLQSEGSYVYFHLQNAKPILVSKNIKNFEEQLNLENGFFRIHRSYLLNVKYFKALCSSSLEVVLNNNENLPISKERKQSFKRYMQII